LVRSEKVSAEDLPVFLGEEDFVPNQ
jgi:hypothetical protein